MVGRQGKGATHTTVEGTLVFADVSGFTRLSERFATLGRVGAEEVTAVIDSACTDLLGVAGEEGGDLLSFGGDALLVLFDGKGHAARAERAARAMPVALAARPVIAAPGGRVRLRISLGVHSGLVHLFFAGGADHKVLVVAGPAASAVVAAERDARPGEVRVTGTLVPLHRPSAPVGPGVPAERFLAPQLRDRLATPVEGEHRRVAVGFVRFTGTDELLAAGDRASVARASAAIDDVVLAAQAAAAAHHVTLLASDIDTDGGKLILTAGAPEAADDDAGRLLAALHELVREPRGLPLRAGAHAGPVFAGEVGSPRRRTYTVMGDTVNLSARLMGAAEPGQLVASAAIVDRADQRFAISPLGELAVKGKRRPVTACAVGAPAAHHAVPAVDSGIPFIGRADELTLLSAAFAAAQRGNGTALVVEGDAGIGKSRLLTEALDRAAGVEVHRVYAQQYHAASSWFAVGALLRSVLGLAAAGAIDPGALGAHLRAFVATNAPELLPWVPLLALPLGVELPPTSEVAALEPRFVPARLAALVVAVLDVALAGPTALVLEQAQWLDPASAGVVRRLAAEAESRPWVVLLAARPGAHPDLGGDATVVPLAPLDGADALALADAGFGDAPVPHHDRSRLAALSGGHPLFLLELVAARLTGDVALPDSVEALLTARLDRLGPEERQLVRDLSVLGPAFSRRLAQRAGIAAGGPLLPVLGALLDSDGVDRVWFRQELIRHVAYEGLPFARRRRLHAQVATAIATDRAGGPGHLPLLSLHTHEAGDWAASWQHSVAAARAAREGHALVEAAALYQRALDAARRIDGVDAHEVAGASEALGDVCERLGRFGDAAGAYRSAGQACGPHAERAAVARLLHKQGVVRERTGSYAAALTWYRKALAHADAAPDPTERARLRAEVGLAIAGIHYRRGRYHTCQRWCMRALADAEVSGERAHLAHGWYLLDAALTDLGRSTDGAARALAVYEELGDLVGQGHALNNLGVNAYYGGRWTEALEHYRASGERCGRAGDVVAAATAANNIGEILSDQGRLAGAEVQFREALSVWRGAAYPLGVALATSNLARTAARSGRTALATELLGDAFARFRTIHAEAFLAETEARLAEAYLLAGDRVRARASLAVVEGHLGGATGVLGVQVSRLKGHLALADGDPSGAAEAFAGAIGEAAALDATYEEALATAGLSACGTPEAPALRRRALEVLTGLDVVEVVLPGAGDEPLLRLRPGAPSRSQEP